MSDAFEHAKKIVSKLQRAGYIAYFAGGWVRDFVMRHPSEDIDIASNAPPDKIMDLFPQTILVGLAFGVVIVVVEGHQFEVATFRKDLTYVDGRRPQGFEPSTPREDALRRDFTINGMFYDPVNEQIHDFVQGREDIERGIIRAIGDPYERFFEDRLRMMRAFRFAARFGFAIEKETQEAIRQTADKLFPAVAMERIWQEFNKMAASPRFDQAVLSMHHLNLFQMIFPELNALHVKNLREFVKSYPFFAPLTPTILYLMEFFPAAALEKKIEIAKRIKATGQDIKLIEWMHALNQAASQKKCDAYQWALLFAHPLCEIGLKILAARDPQRESVFKAYQEHYKSLEPHILRIKTKKPLVTAELLKMEGILPGKKMGLLLKNGEQIAVNEDLHTGEDVLKRLKTLSVWRS